MLSESAGVVYALKPGDHEAGVDCDSFNLGRAVRATFLVLAAALTGNAILKVYSGAAAGTKTTAETFRYRLADADQGSDAADTFGAWATSAALTLTAATYDNRVLVVEIEAQALTEGQPWVTMELGAEATAFNAAIVAILEQPRYQGHDIPTFIA